jgi:hypothetical protein
MPSLEKHDVTVSPRYFPAADKVSPLVLADRLLSLAQDADRAGFTGSAARLLRLAYAVCNERPH